MSYIWEKQNRGNTLYEMALYEARSTTHQKFQIQPTAKDKTNAIKAELGIENVADDGSFLINIDAPGMKEKLQNLLDRGFIREGASSSPESDEGIMKFTLKPGNNPDDAKAVIERGLKSLGAENFGFVPDSDPLTVMVKSNGELTPQAVLGSELGKILASADAASEGDGANTEKQELIKKQAMILNKIVSQYPEQLRLKIALAVYFLGEGKWIDGTNPANEKQAAISKKMSDALLSGNVDSARMALSTIANAITDGKVKVDPNNTGLYSVPNIEKEVTSNIQMPSMFKSEPDDSMWNEMVVTEFGIPLINLSHPGVKKVIESEDPEHECPGELKVFKKKIYENPRLQKVFGKGGFNRVIVDKAFNLLTLGVAAKTTDAGKRADRIIKELKEQGGITAHRNLLLVDSKEILDADAENEALTVPAMAYNRGSRKMVGELEVPITLLQEFYSAVDPVKSAKVYIEAYDNCGVEIKSSEETESRKGETPSAESMRTLADACERNGNALVECATAKEAAEQKPLYEYILGTALAVAAAAAVPQIKNLVAGIKGGNRDNSNPTASKEDAGKFAELKKAYVNELDEKGHPPYYLLKPKSANKEVVVISKASTGHIHGGKVLMVTLQVGEHKAAAFMSPKEVKKYFSV